MNELDFTIEFNSDLENKSFDQQLMAEAETKLRDLAKGHHDIIGAAVTMRRPAKAETAPLHQATVIAYVRPDNVVGKEKHENPIAALNGALEAVERQVRKKREKLRNAWERPENDPVAKEVLEITAAEEAGAGFEDAGFEEDEA